MWWLKASFQVKLFTLEFTPSKHTYDHVNVNFNYLCDH
jgi:hypothetical protein